MARRPSTTKSNENESTEESTVTTTAPEAPVAETESTEPEKVEAPIDLTAFEAAATASVASADESTGVIAPAELDKVLVEYRNLDGVKAKNKAKALLNEGMKSAMNEGDIVKARAYLQLSDSMTSGTPAKTEKAPADPTEAFVQKEATLKLAVQLSTPSEGVAEDWEQRVEALVAESTESASSYLAWLKSDAEDKGDEPEVSAVVRNAVKLALGKAAKAGATRTSAGTYTGERRDIGKHIAEAFAGQPVGSFLTVAEIRKFESDEYGTNPPSAGAISARLFPQSGKCTIENIEPATNEKGNKGAKKIA